MANPEHLELLRKGVTAWNEWKKKYRWNSSGHRGEDLSGADLGDAKLSGADLRGADLSCARLFHADLSGAILSSATLYGAELRGANLTGASLRVAGLERANLGRAALVNSILACANLDHADLTEANFDGADLSDAKIWRANLISAKLRGANLSGADLFGAKLRGADLRDADLRGTNLAGADLTGAQVTGANFHETEFGYSGLDNIDLSGAKGLKHARHGAPSTIGIDTLYLSQGNIPDEFLRDAGVPEDFMTHQLPLIRRAARFQFYSCFITYGRRDEEFARRLYRSMRAADLRVWFAPADTTGTGAVNLMDGLERAIQLPDRVLLVLSDHSVQSHWIEGAISQALTEERKAGRRRLFPIRLTDSRTLEEWKFWDPNSRPVLPNCCPHIRDPVTGLDMAGVVRQYPISDFSNWKDPDAFEQAFDCLLRELKAEEAKPPSRPDGSQHVRCGQTC